MDSSVLRIFRLLMLNAINSISRIHKQWEKNEKYICSGKLQMTNKDELL